MLVVTFIDSGDEEKLTCEQPACRLAGGRKKYLYLPCWLEIGCKVRIQYPAACRAIICVLST